ncbi:protein SHQ1 homolog [Rhynchophorus ferrugineus]|uniref:protein SHQ1 homolog n=1 Tax=Rhynchophorus ferrugineus TaxID=354439 RepID=UPI003FCD77AE
MITPRFKLTQDDKCVSINIRAPYCNLRELDIDIDENVFLFSCKPYFLRLILPGNIMGNEHMKSSFDTESGEFSFICMKQNTGEYFKDLDLITKLLVPKVEANYQEGSINIEVLSENYNTEDICISDDKEDETKEDSNQPNLNDGFGFALRARKDFVRICSTFDEVFEIDPCEVSLPQRHKLRLQYEQGKFNADHYIADYIEDTEISELISLKSPLINDKDSFNFTNSELDFLKDLPNIQYTLSEQQIKYCYNGLLDILFAYCYDQRSTYFDGNIESGWTIVKLASTLSWLDAFETPKEALVTAFRRSVIYPLYRHFQLSQTVLQDLKDLISLDERYLIRILIQIYHIFLKGDCCRYILNNLFIRDYITYIMKWNKEQWKSTVQEVLATNVKKEDLGLNLQEIEDGFNLQEKFANIRINDGDDSDDNDDSSEDSSEDSSSSGSCSSDSETDSDDCSEPIEVLIQKKNSI